MKYLAKKLLWTFLVLFSVVWFYGLASDLVDTLSISSKPLDNIVADGSIFRYRINYANNGADTVGNTQISLYTPRGLHFLTWSVPYDTVQDNLDSYKLWVPWDVCYEQFMNETWIYAELLNQWAQGRYAMDAYDLLFLMPYTPAFSSAPYNGERSMLGEYFVEVVLPSLPKEKSFQDFITKTLEVDDFNTLTWCGLWLKTKYTRDLWSLTAGAWGDITVVLQADDPRRDDIVPLDVIEWTNIDTPMNLSLPIDVDTRNYPVSVSYTNTTDGGISFWPNNPNYPATYSNISMVSWLLNDSMSDQEKAITLWQFVKDTTFNYPFPQEHTWYNSAWSAWDEFVNPIYFLNSLYGMCGEINGTLANLARIAGLSGRAISLNGHVISELQIGSWRGMFDADGGVYWTGEDGHIYSVEELAANPDIMLNNPQDNNYEITGYADMIVNWLYDPGIPELSTDDREKQLFAFLHPNDTITYEYRFLKEIDGSNSNNGYIDDGIGSLTSRLASNVYTTVSGQEFWIISQTETWFMYTNEVPYRVTSLDISLDDPTDRDIQVYVNINDELAWHLIWKLTQRLTYDVANFHRYALRFDCSDCADSDIDNIISQLQIKNNFIFNTRMLPYSWALDIYDTFLSNNVGTGITVSFNKNIDSPVRFSISITWDQAEDVLLNNDQSIDILPLQDYTPALLPSDPTYAREVLEWKWYTSGATSFFDDVPEWTLVGTSALSFLSTDTIPENIIIRSDDVEAFLPADTVVTPSWTICPANTLLAPIDITDDYTGVDFSGVVKAFKVGSPCAGTTLNFSSSVTMRIHTDEVLSGTITVRISSDGETDRQDLTGTKIDDHTIEITTDHFSYFVLESSDGWSNQTDPNDLQINAHWLSDYLDSESHIGYQIHYYNNWTETTNDAVISTTIPSYVDLVSGDMSVATTTTYNTVFGTVDDPCRVDLLNETGKYMEIATAWAAGFWAPNLSTLLLMNPATSEGFSAAPYNWQADQAWNFLDSYIRSDSSYAQVLQDTMHVDLTTIPECWISPVTRYTFDIWSITSLTWWYINLLLHPLWSDVLDSGNLWMITQPLTTVALPLDKNTEDWSLSFSWTNDSLTGNTSLYFNKTWWPLLYDNSTIIDSILTGEMTDQEKAIAAWNLVKHNTFNYPNLTSQSWNINTSASSDSQNPVHLLNSLYGMCGEMNWTLASLAGMLWLQSRNIWLNWHIVVEIMIDGQRGMFDADGGVYWTGENWHIYSVDELAADPNIILNNPQNNTYDAAVYVNMIATTGDNEVVFYPTDGNTGQNMSTLLYPHDTIRYGYSYLITRSVWGKWQLNDGMVTLTRKLTPSHNISDRTDTSFAYHEEMTYLILSGEISTIEPLTQPVKVYLQLSCLDEVFLGNLYQRMWMIINTWSRVDNYYGYDLRFVCDEACDITWLIDQITIKNTAIFNPVPLPYTGNLDVYLLDTWSDFVWISWLAVYNRPWALGITTSISSSLVENDIINNTHSLNIPSFVATSNTWSNNTGDNWWWDNWWWDNWGGTGGLSTGWNPTLKKDVCLNWDLSPSFYDWICTASCTAYSNELNAAYGFARDNGITTIRDCKQADLEWKLLRSHMAKMMSEYAMNVLKKVPDSSKTCLFVDMEGQSNEMKTYAILACQLWLMWYEQDGQTQSTTFNPNQSVDRAQFGTILSRLLRWEKYNGGENYYQGHLSALKQAWIMTKIDAPFALELRWRVMLMMQRIFEKQ